MSHNGRLTKWNPSLLFRLQKHSGSNNQRPLATNPIKLMAVEFLLCIIMDVHLNNNNNNPESNFDTSKTLVLRNICRKICFCAGKILICKDSFGILHGGERVLFSTFVFLLQQTHATFSSTIFIDSYPDLDLFSRYAWMIIFIYIKHSDC